MSTVNYKYSIKADSGYESKQAGTINSDRHVIIFEVLDGGLSDSISVLKAAPDLLEALEDLLHAYCDPGNQGSDHDEKLDAARAAIARAKGEQP